jgi:hypothetical protein
MRMRLMNEAEFAESDVFYLSYLSNLLLYITCSLRLVFAFVPNQYNIWHSSTSISPSSSNLSHQSSHISVRVKANNQDDYPRENNPQSGR